MSIQKKVKHDKEFEQVFDQDCAEYLRFLGVGIVDGERINAPYRPGADSGSFVCRGVFFRDHSHGQSGNVFQLALLMHNGDRREALKSLFECAGLAMPTSEGVEANEFISLRQRVEMALEK